MKKDPRKQKQLALTRRDLLKHAALVGGSAALGVGNLAGSASSAEAARPPVDGGPGAIAAPGGPPIGLPQPPIAVPIVGLNRPTHVASVLRREDLLALRFECWNLIVQQSNLVRKNPSQPAYIVVHLAHGDDVTPQNIAEQAFIEPDPALDPNGGEPLKEPGTIGALLSGPSRLAFRLPDDVDSIPYTLDSLLSWANFEPSVAATAKPPPENWPNPPVPPTRRVILLPVRPPGLINNPIIEVAPTIREPTAVQTAIETPWQLILSPNQYAGWAHAKEPIVHNGRTELWHTRLGIRAADPLKPRQFIVDEDTPTNRTLRAIWTPGFKRNVVPPKPVGTSNLGPFRMSLSPNDRWQLVRLTSDYGISGFTPSPVGVNRLMLSALGAWVDTRGTWQPPTKADKNLDLEEWRHQAEMGRDQYVKVVYQGFLYPFGHAAVLIKVSERKIQLIPSGPMAGSPGAYLRQRFFLVVRQPEKTYPANNFQPHGDRQFPFQRVRITTVVTPNLGDPGDPDWDIQDRGQDAFWPHVSVNGVKKGFEFSLVAEDSDGLETEFTAPLAFLSPARADDPAFLATLNQEFSTGAENKSRRDRPLLGQKVAFAPSGKPGDTSAEVKLLTFGATLPSPPDAKLPTGHPRFYPIWTEAEVRLSAVEQVRGKALAKTVVQPHPDYLASGFNNNPAAIFAKTKSLVPLNFDGGGDKAGALISPNLGIAGLSKTLGPFGGSVTPLPTQFKPAEYFNDAKILGGILLKEIIQAVDFGDGTKIPQVKNEVVYPNNNPFKPPLATKSTLKWQPKLQADPLNIFDPTGASLKVDATFETPINPPAAPTHDILGDLRHFKVNLLGIGDSKFLVLHFNRLAFTAKSGKKTDVDVDITKVEFAGVLEFVNTLKDYLKSGKTGPSIDLTPTGVTTGYTLGMPIISVGVLCLQNISFAAAVQLPFTGQPARVRFAFCERDSPFRLTFYGLGGGGFFGVGIGLDGVELLEASFEVAASLALDIGVASGEVHAAAGIYYKMEKITNPDPGGPTEQATLTAYIRLGGSVSVLGIVNVSIEFYLELRYEAPPKNELWGKATLTVTVKVIFFSFDVDLTVERRLAGGSGSGGSNGQARPLLEAPAVERNFGDLVSQFDWDDYADAFEPALIIAR